MHGVNFRCCPARAPLALSPFATTLSRFYGRLHYARSGTLRRVGLRRRCPSPTRMETKLCNDARLTAIAERMAMSKVETWCAREASVNAGESPAGAIRRFSTEDRANCVAARRGGEPFRQAQGPEPAEGQAWNRTGRLKGRSAGARSLNSEAFVGAMIPCWAFGSDNPRRSEGTLLVPQK